MNKSLVNTLTGVCLGLCCTFAGAAPGSAAKPNIVLLLMDNFGYGEVGVYGGGVLRGAPTPNIDSIAHQGFQLTNFNVEAECTPSRAALMTGRYGIRTRLRAEGEPRGIWYGITPWEVTLAEMLSDAGYSTGMFGKWHLGTGKNRYPTDQGFDEWYGIPNSSDQAFWPDSDSFQADAGVELTRVMTAKRGETPKKHELYGRAKRATIDREITDRAIDFIEREAKAGKPFFAYLPYTQTHEPVDAHPDFKGKTGNGSFADVLAQTDAYVGDVLATLEKLGVAENTIVIFSADNGREGIKRSFGFTGPWRGTMFSPYEGSLRVPFLIRYPGVIPAGQVSNDIVHIIDVFPTLANFAGGELPDDRMLDGVDQSDFFKGSAPKSARESMVIYIGNELFGAKWRNWKMLIKEIDEDSYAIMNMAYPSYYNLIVDPKEEEPEKFYLDDTWVDGPLWETVEAHQASLEKDAGTPDP
ncbi:sulfatase-like hydrolase/transferase [Halioglobus sp. HI00S01]|uniref:sulfatase-like hydrolase/transferase n=1 Tax=Halioglobus sp. HI00S01 TaxID=1822214 RepID=UPI0009ECE0FB|nr:sulfatase-like hydrolase/transferase [Halioglobus sp. HI00S01]